MPSRQSNVTRAAPLCGLVLAGGASTRMGIDKGTLAYHDAPQALWAYGLLVACCGRAYVSVRAAQEDIVPYRDLPRLVDGLVDAGPAAGLAAAWARHPETAWLVLAVDLPGVDAATLATLRDARDAACSATAFRHADGTLEPLCAIWEPRSQMVLTQQLRQGRRSLRRLLEDADICVVSAPEPWRLVSVNTPDEYQALARKGAR
jgi:molybdopterin-guanine dinucleotide biosynthesis protein A